MPAFIFCLFNIVIFNYIIRIHDKPAYNLFNFLIICYDRILIYILKSLRKFKQVPYNQNIKYCCG